MGIGKVNIEDKFLLVSEAWNPKIVGKLNGQAIKIVRIQGEFIRHLHEHEDEMFWVIDGQLLMEFDTHTTTINPGEFIIVPKGTPHKPIAPKETKIILFEPLTTVNTGDQRTERTRIGLAEI